MPDYINQNDKSQVTHSSMGALIAFAFDGLRDSSDTEIGSGDGARILPALMRVRRILALVINFIGTRGMRVSGLLERNFLRLSLFYRCLLYDRGAHGRR